MNRFSKTLLFIIIPLVFLNSSFSYAAKTMITLESSKFISEVNPDTTSVDAHENGLKVTEKEPSDEEVHAHAPTWTVFPFVLLLLMIATGPLFFEHFWHKHYPKVSIFLAIVVVLYYLIALHNTHSPIHAAIEYVPFISLLSVLYIASGGISINIDRRPSPLANVSILSVGAFISNIIGTTGASMLLVRPFVKLNRARVRPYHIIFFIFIVSNVGGSLTPIGDPPLFLGFLKGVPFEWTIINNFFPWLLACILLCVIFYLFDKRNKDQPYEEDEKTPEYSGKIKIQGSKNFLWLVIVIMTVFFDPNIFSWVPFIPYDGLKVSFIKEVIWILIAYFSYRFANKRALVANDFSFEPIKEVAFIFIGIFGTMMPAIDLVGVFASSEEGARLITHNSLYWGTGSLSGLLDNAPTYINFLTAAMAANGLDISVMSDVSDFAGGDIPNSILYLQAISVAAVFFGAMTYIGNGPNFMVKSIAEQIGIKMPSFFGYIVRYSIPILLPVLVIIWLVFFAFA